MDYLYTVNQDAANTTTGKELNVRGIACLRMQRVCIFMNPYASTSADISTKVLSTSSLWGSVSLRRRADEETKLNCVEPDSILVLEKATGKRRKLRITKGKMDAVVERVKRGDEEGIWNVLV